MPKPRSINQNLLSHALPDFRNLGTTLRIMLLVNIVALLVSFAQAYSWLDAAQHFVANSASFQPVWLSSLLRRVVFNPWLARLKYWQGGMAVILLVALTALALFLLAGTYAPATGPGSFHAWRNALLGAAYAALLLAYFRLRAQALSPALHSARLQALQARIRPHFLFNTINAVLSIVRADPRRAEVALEDMADLFRMAMADNRDLVLLRREVELSRQYLALEQLRLGERLTINWQVDEALNDALMPPLMLQPLLENAVYHGIEPSEQGGTIDIKLQRNGNALYMDVRNSSTAQGKHHSGNKMALENIRARLALQFDVEAQYAVERGSNFYHVHIQMPYVREESK